MVLRRMTGFMFCLKEVLDNAIDEFMMGFGKTIEITINEDIVRSGITDGEFRWERCLMWLQK